MSNTLFPVFLKTETAKFLIVGGGNGLEKTETLLKQNPGSISSWWQPIFIRSWKRLFIKMKIYYFYERAFEATDLDNKDFGNHRHR